MMLRPRQLTIPKGRIVEGEGGGGGILKGLDRAASAAAIRLRGVAKDYNCLGDGVIPTLATGPEGPVTPPVVRTRRFRFITILVVVREGRQAVHLEPIAPVLGRGGSQRLLLGLSAKTPFVGLGVKQRRYVLAQGAGTDSNGRD